MGIFQDRPLMYACCLSNAQVATDCINNHQTVRALSVEQKFLDIYCRKLKEAYK